PPSAGPRLRDTVRRRVDRARRRDAARLEPDRRRARGRSRRNAGRGRLRHLRRRPDAPAFPSGRDGLRAMDLSFGEEQQAITRLARDIFDGHVTSDRLKEVEASPDRFDRALWAELARANLLGVGIGENDGGIGGGIVEVCLVLEQAGATVAPVPLWPTLALGVLPVARFGSPEQKAALLGRVVAGDVVLSAGLAEPGSDDPLRPATTATWEGDAWRLDGVKTSVPAATPAERVLVPASTENGAGVFLLDPRAGGLTIEPQRSTSGEVLARPDPDGAAVPESDVLVE